MRLISVGEIALHVWRVYPSFWAPIKSDDLGGGVTEYFFGDFVGAHCFRGEGGEHNTTHDFADQELYLLH